MDDASTDCSMGKGRMIEWIVCAHILSVTTLQQFVKRASAKGRAVARVC